MPESDIDAPVCPRDVVAGLVEVVATALAGWCSNQVAVPDADGQDVELMIDALRVLRPRLQELDYFVAVLHLVRGDCAEAARVLYALEQAVPMFSHTQALLAVCLSRMGDENWRRHAERALELNGSASTRYMVMGLRAQADLLETRKKVIRGEAYSLPASYLELVDLRRSVSGVEAQVADEPSAPVRLPYYGRWA